MSMFIRVGGRIAALASASILAVRAKLVPSALDRAVKTFTAAEGLLARAEDAASQRLEKEQSFRRTLRDSRDASYERSINAQADRERAARIRNRLSSLLD